MNNQMSTRRSGEVCSYVSKIVKIAIIALFIYSPIFANTPSNSFNKKSVSIIADFTCFEAENCEASDMNLSARVLSCQSEDKLVWKYIVYNDATDEIIQYSYNYTPTPSSGTEGNKDIDILTNSMQAKFNITTSLPIGLYRVHWTLIDDVVHEFHKTQFFSIVDNEPPTPELYQALHLTEFRTSAKYFDKGSCGNDCIDSHDNCSDDIYFTFSPTLPHINDDNYSIWAKQFNKYGKYFFDPESGLISTESRFLSGEADAWLPEEKTSVRALNCQHIINKKIRIYVWDQFAENDDCDYNNFSYEDVGVYLSYAECDLHYIAGYITTVENTPIEGMNVEFTTDKTYNTNTNSSGSYDFNDFNYVYDMHYTIEAYSDKNFTNGVTTLDIVLIQKHLLGIKPLNTPFKLIAADVNRDGKIAASDILEIRNTILSRRDSFTNNSWVGIPKSYKFKYPNNATREAEKARIHEDYMCCPVILDFWGIKIGDISQNAYSLENRDMKSLVIDDKDLINGQTYTIPVYAKDFNNLIGFQFAIDAIDIDIIDIKNSVLNLKNAMNIVDGKLLISWNNSKAIDIKDNDILFEIVAKANKTGKLSSFLTLDKSFASETYFEDGDIEANHLELQFRDNDSTPHLKQNYPNPFTGNTTIEFNLGSDIPYTLTFFDINGKILNTIKGIGNKGVNLVSINKSLFKSNNISQKNQSGIIFYKLTTEDYTAYKKMLLINHQS